MEVTANFIVKLFKWLVLLFVILASYACARSRDFCLVKCESSKIICIDDSKIIQDRIIEDQATLVKENPVKALYIKPEDCNAYPDAIATFYTSTKIKSEKIPGKISLFSENRSVKSIKSILSIKTQFSNNSDYREKMKFIFGLLIRISIFIIVVLIIAALLVVLF